MLLLQYTVVAFAAPLRYPATVFADSIAARMTGVVGGWLATGPRCRSPKGRCSLADLGSSLFIGLVYSISFPFSLTVSPTFFLALLQYSISWKSSYIPVPSERQSCIGAPNSTT